MRKKINITKSVYEICKDYPDVIEIMKNLGFESITNPGMINTAGRFMTIPKGASMKNISMDKIREEFAKNGYEISGE
ncbi:DUF1858 domain-containing protein [Lutispora thermophila]|uniref:DUF1858 domain-containing protein n=1 Tax=Lutispora thermophila DSM 19022 TaxID=1122184 RepID=A0A1M6C9L9_9FIRM|nr:DUF1858 domain-containing protein [Lutispora thermophila]SHI57717.1 protein of unknown function [Lutispora thermophila DSM 19022]